MSTDIVVVGSLNVDLVVTCEALPSPGQTVFGKGFHMFPGGKGANQAVAAARLGAVVTHAGCVGADANGNWLRERLSREGVADRVASEAGAATGVALITVADDGQNTIAVVPGANGRVTPAMVGEALAGIDGGLLLLQLEIPLPAVEAAARAGREREMTVILNPAPAVPVPPDLLNLCDYVIPNETEAALLSGRTVTTREEAREASRRLAARGRNQVIVTLGDRGAVSSGRHGEFDQSPWPVAAVDATAAGDAFVAAFAVALGRGLSLAAALDWAAAAGALTCTRLGAQESLPTAAELADFTARGRGA